MVSCPDCETNVHTPPSSRPCCAGSAAGSDSAPARSSIPMATEIRGRRLHDVDGWVFSGMKNAGLCFLQDIWVSKLGLPARLATAQVCQLPGNPAAPLPACLPENPRQPRRSTGIVE